MNLFKRIFSRCKSANTQDHNAPKEHCDSAAGSEKTSVPRYDETRLYDDTDYSMKYLIAGLGNVGEEYEGTRHNAGFMVVEALAKSVGTPDKPVKWTLERKAYRTEFRLKGRTVVMIKPTTYMNLSGEAIRYWLQAEKVPQENLLVVVDDIALPVGTLRMKKQGSGGGHNGLGNIEQMLGGSNYCRLRVGVGNNFSRGRQIDYVLGAFDSDELALLEPKIETACEAVKCFVTQGPDRAMNMYNTKG